MRIFKRERRTILPQIAADFNDGASTSVNVRTIRLTSLIWVLRADRRLTCVRLWTRCTKLYSPLVLQPPLTVDDRNKRYRPTELLLQMSDWTNDSNGETTIY
ncbi:hypothetical protein AVEN_242530-1 [Araneus ventricosus]|uniref:Uncharacterized protein n=1 Tax=Araneus ventricosus TaxID=182803 RepID=A0A4Y2VST1_ARAVE|nr:hypothetical protein AVEN_242530-1 [Araneus ventricosus]